MLNSQLYKGDHMKIVLTSSTYILVVVYYPLSLIPQFLINHLNSFSIIDGEYIPFYFIISKKNNKPVKVFLSKTKAEHSYHTFNKESGLIKSFSPLYVSYTITTEEINKRILMKDIEFNCDSTIENTLEQDELTLIASISNNLKDYIRKVMTEIISKKERLLLKNSKELSFQNKENDYHSPKTK